MRCLLLTVVGLGLAGGPWETARGAEPSERRREFLEGVLRGLMETQVLPHLAPDRKPPPPDRKPPPPGPAVPPPPGGPRPHELRRDVEEFAALAGELLGLLRQEERARPEIRPLLGDALAVKALSDALLRRADVLPDRDVFVTGFPAIDRQWRTLALRLERSYAVSAACRECVRRLEACDRRICQRLGLGAQLDREAILPLVATLAGHLRSLLDEAAVQLRDTRDGPALLAEGRRLQVLVNALATTASHVDNYEVFVSQYRLVYGSWQTFVERMRSQPIRSGERHIRRINHVYRQLSEVLWLPYEPDRRGMTHFAAVLRQQVDALTERVSLKRLLATPDPLAVVAAVRELQTMSADFAGAAAGQDPVDSLRWDFRPLDVQWQQVQSRLQNPPAPELAQPLADLDETIQALQELLDIAPLVDLEGAVVWAAEVDSLADLLQRDLVDRVSQSPRYPPPYRRDATASADAFHKSAHQFHEDLTRRPPPEVIRKNADALSAAWQAVQEHVAKLEPPDRAHVTRHYERLAPAMARLQMMFVY